LQGCASQRSAALDEASAAFQKVKEDSNVLRMRRDVIRAGESLARAERLSSYMGQRRDVRITLT
jgi:hypothetical protein